jgi:hypothetical protein
VFELGDFVLELEFSALQFSDFGIGGRWVGEGFLEFGLEGLVFSGQFTEMRLKAHAFPPLVVYVQRNDDTDLGACRTLDKGIGEEHRNAVWKFRNTSPDVKLDTLQEVALRAKLQSLLQQHRDLDTAISSLEASGAGDQLQLRRLKKMKLDLKDRIQQIENLLIPDIIA